MSLFNLKIISDKGILCDEQVGSAYFKAFDGEIGVLPKHENYIGILGKGKVIAKSEDGQQKEFDSNSGFYRVEEGNLILLLA